MNPANMQQLRRRSPSPRGRRTYSNVENSIPRARGGSDIDRLSASDEHFNHHRHRHQERQSRPSLKTTVPNELEPMANILGSINHQEDDHKHSEHPQYLPHHDHHHREHHHEHHHDQHKHGERDHATHDHQSQPEHSQVPREFKRVPSLYTPGMEDRLKRRLKVFFMDPYSKYKAKHQWPWKLTLQLLKVILVTIQLVRFGHQRSAIVTFFEQNQVALKHLLLNDWDPTYETLPYPPATGVYALYSRTGLINHINFAMEQYYQIPENAIGCFHLERDHAGIVAPINFCRLAYSKAKIFVNGSFIINSTTDEFCLSLECPSSKNSTTGKMEYHCDIKKMLDQNNSSIQYDRLLKITMTLRLKTFHLNMMSARPGPVCFHTNVEIEYDNMDRDGQVQVHLTAAVEEITCKEIGADNGISVGETVFDSIIISLCVLSVFLCLRSIYRAQKLKRETQKFFASRFGKKLSHSDRLEFLNMWYVLIVCNDILTVTGTCFKLLMEYMDFSSSSRNYDIGSVCLGVGCLLAWLGVLRYLGFFEKYNVLIVTLKKAFPNVLRFLVCAMVLYFGFTFCGWLVLGPYHIKFRTLSSASECLYSLVNGDDMFVTFSALMARSDLIWYFSRMYLYSFISLFIYIVLSLFIAVIMDTYETIKYCYEHGFPKSDLWKFVDECDEPADSLVFIQDQTRCCLFNCFSCCRRENSDEPNENTGLLSQST